LSINTRSLKIKGDNLKRIEQCQARLSRKIRLSQIRSTRFGWISSDGVDRVTRIEFGWIRLTRPRIHEGGDLSTRACQAVFEKALD
jgi:hypothetical protein